MKNRVALFAVSVAVSFQFALVYAVEPLTSPAAIDTPLYVNPFEYTVTAPRMEIPLRQSPAATTVVGEGSLQSLPRGVSVDEALKIVPGVRIDNNADGERVHLSIRGQGILVERGIRGIKLLLDGLPLNDPSGVAPDLYDVDWSTIKQVEVLRGPAAALYGGGASGGIVNITTDDGGTTPVGAELSASVGSYGFWKTLAQIGGTDRDVNYRVSASRMMSDGYRVHNAVQANNMYGKFQWNASPSLQFTEILGWTDYLEENAEGLNSDQVAQDPRQPNPDALTYDEYYKTSRISNGLLGHAQLTPDQDIAFNGYFRYTKYKEPVPTSVLERDIFTPGASVQYNLRHGFNGWKNTVSAGSDFGWQAIDEQRVQNLGGANEGALLTNERLVQQGVGIFLLDRIEFGTQWGVIGCLRYDNNRNELSDRFKGDITHADVSGMKSFERVTGKVGLAYTPLTQLNLYANWGQGFLPPGTEELANNPLNLGGLNRDLSPSTSAGEEIGARGILTQNLTYDITGFSLTTDNDFYRFRIDSRPLETFYRNIGSTRRSGVEALLTWQPLHNLRAEAAYTYSNFKYTKPQTDIDPNDPAGVPYTLKDHWLPNSPQHQTFADVEYEVLPRLTVAVNHEYQSLWYVDAQNSASVKGFTLWGARVSYAWKLVGLNGDIMIAGRNLLDEKYIAFSEPDPGGNSYQPGPTHEVYGGVKITL